KTGPITLISKEPDPAYSRVALPYILSKEKNLPHITLQDDGYFRANNVETIIGTGASGLDTANKTVTLENGRDISYDKLLIATGSTSRVPPVLGIDQADVCYHWTLADTRKLEEQMANARTCFVIGAGFISLLTVSALIKGAPLKYTVVEIADQVMPQLLDETGGKALERGMREKGIEVVLGDSVSAIDQGRGAGANMAGYAHTYPGSLSWNVTELFGLASASVGEFRDRPGLEPIVFHNAAANIYRKLLLDANRIVGAVVIGRAEHIQDLGVVQAMIRRKTDISKWKHMLGGERINYGMLAYETIKR